MKPFPSKKLLLYLFFSLYVFSINAQKSDYKNWKVNYDRGIELRDSTKNKKALPYFETAYQIAQKSFTKKEYELEKTAYNLAKIYKKIREYNKAIPLYLVSLDNLKLNGRDMDSIYGKRLSQLGVTYRLAGKYEKATETLIKSLDVIETSLGKEHFEYGENLLQLSIVYKKQGDFAKAISTNKASNEIIKKLYGSRSKEYAKNLSSLSQIYSETGEYGLAIPIQKNVLKSYLKKDKKSISYVLAIFTMAVLYHDINEYKKEIPLYEEVMQILDEDHRGTIGAYNNLSEAYKRLGNYEKALFYAKKAIGKTSATNPELPTRLQNIAFIYVSMGNYKKALNYYDKALIAVKNIYDTNHYLYGRLVNNIGKLYLQKGDIFRAKKLFKEALDNFLKNFDENHIKYGYYLNDYASTLLETGNTEEAILLMKRNLSIFEKNSRTETEDYYKFQYNLAKAYNKSSNYSEALPLLLQASDGTKNILGADHSSYGRILESLSDTYIGLGEINKAIYVIESSNDIRIAQIDKIFKFRSENEKKAFLNTTVKTFNHMQSIPLNCNANFEKLHEMNLNNQLMLKGLLLNNSKNLIAQLSTLSDSVIDSKIILYRSIKREYSKLLTLPIEDRTKNIVSLNEAINTKEAELVKLYSSNFKDNLQLVKDWKLSQSKLGNDDIAIEYSSFQVTNKNRPTDSIMYVAYVFKKNWNHPKMIPLFEEKQLKNKSSNELYNSKKLYDLVWLPLEKYIGNSTTIYYAPSGILNQISFAAIKEDNVALVATYNLVRLSSTGVLVEELVEPVASSTLFIGAIDYDYIVTQDKEIESKENAYLDTESLRNSKATRSRGESWNELPGALIEINGLQSILESNDYNFTTFTRKEASEGNFKKLSGNSPSIIHIATHGFFYENLGKKLRGNMNLSTEDQYRLAEDPLLRSGLIFAGANYAWKNGANPNEEEDGILTAMEISNLDLSNTDMVVLSACETGLGDIDSSEGVYGLQRAFKMAGVDIIIMSLWKVPDVETAEFMNLFYNNWITKQKVRKAFNQAQQTMQNKYQNESLKWAAFVLFE